MRKRRSIIAVILACTAALLSTSQLEAQSKPSRIALERQIINAFDRDNQKRALNLIDQYLVHWPNDSNMLYNAACGHAALGERELAADRLLEAVRAGFREFDHMEEDPDLEPIRDHDVFLAILEARDQTSTAPAPEATEEGTEPTRPGRGRELALVPRSNRGSEEFADWEGEHPDGYIYESDARHRLHYGTPLTEEAHEEMTSMLGRQADQMADSLFGAVQSDWIFVLVPDMKHQAIFNIDSETPGWYEHGRRMLVTADIGASLRHEFAHVLHWGHMDRTGQRHPMWVQEGLASLYEEYAIDDASGRIKFRPNERHNIARRLVADGEAPAWRALFSMTPVRFMRGAERNYPLVRSIFEFIAARGKLETWYRTLVETWDGDKDGITALERTFEASLDEIEESWERWLRSRGRVDDMISVGDASIGISATDAVDGCLVTRINPGSGAADAGIREQDVIVELGSRTVRSTRELMLAVASRRVGETVLVRIRRGTEYLDLPVTLKPLGR
jgi:hypothetical protein